MSLETDLAVDRLYDKVTDLQDRMEMVERELELLWRKAGYNRRPTVVEAHRELRETRAETSGRKEGGG